MQDSNIVVQPAVGHRMTTLENKEVDGFYLTGICYKIKGHGSKYTNFIIHAHVLTYFLGCSSGDALECVILKSVPNIE